MRVGAYALLLMALSGCLDGVEVEGQTFPCRRASDCVEGYECHPTEWICVPTGTSDAGPNDAGLSDGG